MVRALHLSASFLHFASESNALRRRAVLPRDVQRPSPDHRVPLPHCVVADVERLVDHYRGNRLHDDPVQLPTDLDAPSEIEAGATSTGRRKGDRVVGERPVGHPSQGPRGVPEHFHP